MLKTKTKKPTNQPINKKTKTNKQANKGRIDSFFKSRNSLPHFLSKPVYYDAKDNPLHLRRGL